MSGHRPTRWDTIVKVPQISKREINDTARGKMAFFFQSGNLLGTDHRGMRKRIPRASLYKYCNYTKSSSFKMALEFLPEEKGSRSRTRGRGERAWHNMNMIYDGTFPLIHLQEYFTFTQRSNFATHTCFLTRENDVRPQTYTVGHNRQSSPNFQARN